MCLHASVCDREGERIKNEERESKNKRTVVIAPSTFCADYEKAISISFILRGCTSCTLQWVCIHRTFPHHTPDTHSACMHILTYTQSCLCPNKIFSLGFPLSCPFSHCLNFNAIKYHFWGAMYWVVIATRRRNWPCLRAEITDISHTHSSAFFSSFWICPLSLNALTF